MSKRINVNPDHYKVAGRERPGDAVAKAPKSRPTSDEQVRQRWDKKQGEKEKKQK